MSGRTTTLPVWQDDFLHVVGHEKIIETSELIPLQECFLSPEGGRQTHRFVQSVCVPNNTTNVLANPRDKEPRCRTAAPSEREARINFAWEKLDWRHKGFAVMCQHLWLKKKGWVSIWLWHAVYKRSFSGCDIQVKSVVCLVSGTFSLNVKDLPQRKALNHRWLVDYI